MTRISNVLQGMVVWAIRKVMENGKLWEPDAYLMEQLQYF